MKPKGTKYRFWDHGRVVAIPRPGLAEVDCLRCPGRKKKYKDPIYTVFCHCPNLNVSVNDAVLYLQDSTPGLPYEELQPYIRVVYTENEAEKLRDFGVEFPDCPPEMMPAGYYG